MKKIWNFLAYFYLWQVAIVIGVGIGVIMKILTVGFNNQLTFALGIGSFVLLFFIPFSSSSTALREMIAKPQLVMVPGLKLHAGIAHLVLCLVASLFLYINFLAFAVDDYSLFALLRIFTAISVFAGFMQLVLPSRYFIPAISLSPLLFVIVTLHFQEPLAAIFLDRSFTIALFLVTVASWGWGMNKLAANNNFKAAFISTDMGNSEVWASYDGGFLTQLAIGQSRTPQGTLLLGYPDNWGAIFLRILYYFVITPLFTSLALFIIGVGERTLLSVPDILARLFLFMSLFAAVFCCFIYGELAARARLLWLRYGTDRRGQWQLVDYYCLRFLSIYYLCALAITYVLGSTTNIELPMLIHYLLLVISVCFFNLYLSLLVKTYRLSPLFLTVIIIVTMCSMGFCIIEALRNTTPSDTLLIVFEIVMAVLGLSCRALVRQSFNHIDWRLVSVSRTPGKYSLSGENA